MSNKNKGQKQLTPSQQFEAMRNQVLVVELEARFAKANYDKMYYAIEGEKLIDDYKGFQTRENERRIAAQKQYDEFIAGIKKAQEESSTTEEGEATTPVVNLETEPEETRA
jgi:hypothetical protein